MLNRNDTIKKLFRTCTSKEMGVSCAGFTLIEILLAVTILALIIGSLYATFAGSMENIQRVEKQSNGFHVGRLILTQIIMDLESLYFDSSVIDDMTEEGDGVFTGKEKSGEKEGERMDEVTFLTTSSLVTETASGNSQIKKVSYFLLPEEGEKTYMLVRRAVPYKLGYEETTGGNNAEELAENDYVLSRQVRSLKFEYVDLEGDKKDSWGPVSGNEQNLIPAQIKVSLILENPYGTPIELSTRVFLPLSLLTSTAGPY